MRYANSPSNSSDPNINVLFQMVFSLSFRSDLYIVNFYTNYPVYCSKCRSESESKEAKFSILIELNGIFVKSYDKSNDCIEFSKIAKIGSRGTFIIS